MEIVSVKVENGDINKALKTFKKRCMDAGHLQEYKDRQQYLKPSVVKREMMQPAKRVNYLQQMEEKRLNSD